MPLFFLITPKILQISHYEWLRLFLNLFTATAFLYGFTILFSSVSMSLMLVESYLLFSILFSLEQGAVPFCLLRPQARMRAAVDVFSDACFYLLALAVFILASVCEKRTNWRR